MLEGGTLKKFSVNWKRKKYMPQRKLGNSGKSFRGPWANRKFEEQEESSNSDELGGARRKVAAKGRKSLAASSSDNEAIPQKRRRLVDNGRSAQQRTRTLSERRGDSDDYLRPRKALTQQGRTGYFPAVSVSSDDGEDVR